MPTSVLDQNADDISGISTSALRPWTPTSVLKVHGFDDDCDENNVEDEARPGETPTGEAHISDELTSVSAVKPNYSQTAYDSFKNEAIPSPAVPITIERKGKTMEDVLREIRYNRAEWINEDGRVAEPRVRRKIMEGSYPNFTVKDEDDLPSLLRYVWKGKLKKLKKYLEVGERFLFTIDRDCWAVFSFFPRRSLALEISFYYQCVLLCYIVTLC